MLKITFDKDLATEASLDLDRVSEYPITRNLSGARTIIVQHESDFPDVSDFIGRTSFQTVEITDGNLTPLPICDCYNTITDITTSYNDEQKMFMLSITLGTMDQT